MKSVIICEQWSYSLILNCVKVRLFLYLLSFFLIITPAYCSGRILSPTLNELQTSIRSGSSLALGEFWKTIEHQGSPLIEPSNANSKKMLVTFLWKHSRNTESVAVFLEPYGLMQLDENHMTRIENSDVWFKTISIRKESRFVYGLVPNPPPGRAENAEKVFAILQSDPLNPHWRPRDRVNNNPTLTERESIVEMPFAPKQIWIEKRDVPSGTIEKISIKSNQLKNEREVSIYLPPGYESGKHLFPTVILFDRVDYLDVIPTPVIVDNLIAAKKIPPIIVAFVGHPSPAGENRMRELTCNRKFSDFLKDELIPLLKSKYAIAVSSGQLVVGGASVGGLAAACAGLHHPETFGNIISQSGSFWWSPSIDLKKLPFVDPSIEQNAVANEFAHRPKLALRFYLDAGTDEVNIDRRVVRCLLPSKHLRDVLTAKGYEVHWQEFIGGHDGLSWRGTFSDALIALLGTKVKD